MSERRILIETARAIVDGDEVDWRGLTETHPELTGRLRNLRLLSRLVEHADDEVGPTLGPGDTWGPLQIRERVGEGSFGEVYRAYEPTLDREVALKIHRDGDAVLPLDEARRLARVRHPNVLTIHGVERHDGHAGMWTDFIEGRTVEAWIEADAPIDEGALTRIGSTLCGALAAVHDAGLVHADVKAANVMLERSGRLVLMDFGAGRDARDTPSEVRRPAFGTPLVMAPELLRGDEPSVVSDVYAVGVLLYRLATGRYPVEVATRQELVERLDAGGTPPVAEVRGDLSPRVAAAITEALALDPAGRPVSARALGERLGDPDDVGLAEEVRIPGRPAFETRFVGRGDELARIRDLLRPGTVLTLVGAGGSGKTRLAHEVMGRMASDRAGATAWIDLVPLADAEAIALELCRRLQVSLEGDVDAIDALGVHLGAGPHLLCLDNAEHLAPEVTRVVDALRTRAPEVAILLTSRTAVGARDERTVAVDPLPVPGADDAESATVLESDAVRLFVTRATAARSSFRLTDANAGAVAAICRRVDGIPLALELAAARVGTLGESELSDRLERSLGLLRDRTGTRRPQHETVRALIDWSLALLSPSARRLFDRMSAFAGGATLIALETVCADGPPQTASLDQLRDPGGPDPTAHPSRTTIDGEEIADLVADLVEHSLVTFEPGDAPRYRMLALVRDAAVERLAASPDDDGRAIAWRHHDWHRDLSLRVLGQTRSKDPGMWLDRLGRELDNVRIALELPVNGRGETLSRLGFLHGVGTYFRRTGQQRQGVRALEQVHAFPRIDGDVHFRASVHNELGNMYTTIGEISRGFTELERGLEVRREEGDPAQLGVPIFNLGIAYMETGDTARAEAYLDDAMAAFEAAGDARGRVYATNMRGVCRERAGDDAAALELYLAATEMQAGVDDPWASISTRNNVAGSLLRQDRAAEALPHAEEGLRGLRALGDPVQLAGSLVTLANIQLKLGALDACHEALVEVAGLHQQIEHPFGILHASGMWGLYLVAVERDEDAALALGFCRRWADTSGIPLAATDAEEVVRELDRLRDRLGDRFDAVIQEADATEPRALFARLTGEGG